MVQKLGLAFAAFSAGFAAAIVSLGLPRPTSVTTGSTSPVGPAAASPQSPPRATPASFCMPLPAEEKGGRALREARRLRETGNAERAAELLISLEGGLDREAEVLRLVELAAAEAKGMGRQDLALDALSRALALDPGNRAALELLTTFALLPEKPGIGERAALEIEKAARAHPRNPVLQSAQADLLSRAGRLSEAIAVLENLGRENRNLADEQRFQLADLHYLMGNRKAATSLFQARKEASDAALSRNPSAETRQQNLLATIDLASAVWWEGRRAEALAILTPALEQNPDNPTLRRLAESLRAGILATER